MPEAVTKTVEEIAKFLDECTRDTLSDQAFGDSEVSWFKDGVYVADGYFSSRSSSIVAIDGSWSFDGEFAKMLRDHGKAGKYQRNDAGDPREQ